MTNSGRLTLQKKWNQRKRIHEHFCLKKKNKNELVEFLLALPRDLFRVIHALQIGMSTSIHELEHHFTMIVHYRAHSLHSFHFLGESKAQQYNLQQDFGAECYKSGLPAILLFFPASQIV